MTTGDVVEVVAPRLDYAQHVGERGVVLAESALSGFVFVGLFGSATIAAYRDEVVVRDHHTVSP